MAGTAVPCHGVSPAAGLGTPGSPAQGAAWSRVRADPVSMATRGPGQRDIGQQWLPPLPSLCNGGLDGFALGCEGTSSRLLAYKTIESICLETAALQPPRSWQCTATSGHFFSS